MGNEKENVCRNLLSGYFCAPKSQDSPRLNVPSAGPSADGCHGAGTTTQWPTDGPAEVSVTYLLTIIQVEGSL